MRTTWLVGALVLGISTSAQDWDINGNAGTTFGTHYVGTSDATWMSLGTYGKVRLVANEEDTYTIGSFSSIPAYGFIGISPSSYFWDNGPGPFSLLHLAEPGANGFQGIGYRPWMRNGVTFTGNHDHGYVGQRYYGHDSTDLVIHWSDNPGTWLGRTI